MLYKITKKRKLVFFYLPTIGTVLLCFLLVGIASYLRNLPIMGSLYLFLMIFSVMGVFVIIPMILIYWKFLQLSENIVLKLRGDKCCYRYNNGREINFYKSQVIEIQLYKLPSAHKRKVSFMFIDNFYLYTVRLDNEEVLYLPSIVCEKIEDIFDCDIDEKKKSMYSFLLNGW